MKRCPECGYRVKADLKKCPLCEGRMVEDKTVSNKALHAKSHAAEGGACLLEEKPAKPRPMPADQEGVSKGRWANDAFSPVRFLPIVLVILFMMLRACAL